jgi:hypothetical protein
MLGIYRVAAQVVASRAVLSSTELVMLYPRQLVKSYQPLLPEFNAKSGNMGGVQNGTGAGYLKILQFPIQFSCPLPTLHYYQYSVLMQ